MRWELQAFGISGLLFADHGHCHYMGVRGLQLGLDFTGGTVIEITLEKPAEMDVMRGAGYEGPQLQNFGSSHDIMKCVCRQPKVRKPAVRVLGSKW